MFEEAYRRLYSRAIPGVEIEILSWVLAVSARVAGQHVMVYDDMVRTGASLLAAAQAYRDAGAARITALATQVTAAPIMPRSSSRMASVDRVSLRS